MISRLRGTVLAKDFEGAVIDVHGVGFRVAMPMTSLEHLPMVGQEAEVYTMMGVREDAIELYGFHDDATRKVFAKLIGVSGVGPKLGMSFLSGMAAGEVVSAVVSEDVGALTKIKGVGKKTASRLVLELKETLSKLSLGGEGLPLPTSGGGAVAGGAMLEDLRSALVNLGYPPATAEKAVDAVSGQDKGDFDDMLRAALKALRNP